MTFDDGPFIYTNELLDILEEHEVRATFFINGDSAGQIGDYTEAVQRAFDAGHQIASHTWHHVDLATQTNIEIEYQMSHLDEVLKDIIGVRPRYMRPPYGSLSENARKKLINMGYEIVSWSVDTNDWRHPTNVWESMKAYRMAVLQRHRGQFIVLQHETIMNTVRKLVPAAIKMLKAKGFQIVPVGACLGVEPDDWYRE
ncbi:chitin deacetylase [Lunasporangiospora selenospora]|uniref:Chitin deacetylase n=1 Tax=Lunasporangiospora selenospora TaxID=979761 RepID=A0A9P6FTP0_9FUNG|nr:chitin deacetylase [Lunasporangiospora selenospora]